MTKKELLENDAFMALPDDAEIVFATDVNLKHCVPLTALNISARKGCINMPKFSDMPLSVAVNFRFEPKYMCALVIDAIPYWYLKERYGITISNEDV